MALQLGYALSAAVDVNPLPLSTVEGGTRLNFTIRLEHNRTEDIFNDNSTACRDLRNHTVFVNLLISLPIVFDIVRSKNDSMYNGSVLTDLTNCTSVNSFLDINSSLLAPRDNFGLNGLKFELLSLNVSWTTNLGVELMLQHSVRPDSLLNITANVSFLDETKQLHIASYTTPIPGSLQLLINRTSIPGTPGIVLTTEEEITFHATFKLPRITADLKLELLLPTFQNSTPLRFLSASVLSVSSGIMAEKLVVGSTPQVRVGVPNLGKFPRSPNIAEFVFGKTVNKANASFNGAITVEATGIVDSLQGVYVPDTKGNITCVLKYKSAEGFITAEQTSLMVELGQPLLEHHLAIYGPVCCYEGNDVAQFGFEVGNPEFSTAPALNLSATIGIVPPDLEIQSISVELCSNISVSNHTGNQSSLLQEVNCTNLVGSSSLVNHSSSFEISLSRLNSSCWIHGNLTALVKPSVAANSLHPTDLTLVYTRKGWGYVSTTDTQTIQIEPVTARGPFVISTSVPHPLRDQESITIGEVVVFQLELSLPESTNDDFIIVVHGDGLEGEAGNVVSVGGNIKSLDRHLGPTALNITSGVIPGVSVSLSSPALTGSFGTVVNTGNLSQSSASEIVYDASIGCENRSLNVRGYHLNVDFAVYINSEPQLIRSHFLTVVEPHLTVQLTPSQTAGVKPDSELHFTVRLRHSGLSTTHAYVVALEIAVPQEYMTGVQQTVPPGVGTLSILSVGNSRSDRLLVYEATELLLGQSVSFQYKARTVSNLQPSLYVSFPVHVSYTSLPLPQASLFGRTYKADSDEGTFLTFRPSSFIEVVFSSPNGSFDGGDRVEYKLTLKNVAADSSTQAYEISVDVTFKTVDTNQMYISCDRGSQTFNATAGVSVLSVASLTKSQTVFCNYTSFIQSHVSPREVISQQASVRYYNRPLSGSPINYASYMERITANVTIEPINATFIASANAEQLMAGDPVNFTLHLQLPECVTNLSVVVDLPSVSRDVIALSRRRRDEEILRRNNRDRSRVRRNPGVVYSLEPILSDSYVIYDDGVAIPNITQVNQESLEIVFGVVQNLPGSGSNGSIVIFLKFKTADEPLVLSGRPLALFATLNFDAGSDFATKQFIVVGPLVKPLLIISKSAEQLDTGQDSPPITFNVTVSHANNSMYDAHNVTVTDSADGMDYYNPSGADEGFVTSPRKNTFIIHFSLPSLRIGESKTFLYRGQFKVNVKEPVTIRNPAETTWRSIQLNSPIYRLLSSTDSGCVTRNDVSDPRTRKVFGYFALGIILGLLFGAVIAGILILVIVKCCDKGKMAPYYTRFTNTSTMTVLTGGSEYIYHGRDLPENKPVEKHTEACIVQTDESIVPILTLDSATQTEKELNSLDVQATAALDADLESQRQSMFMKALSLLARKLRVKREISSEQENHFVTELKQVIGAVATKMAAEYKERSAELRRKLQRDGKSQLDALHSQQRKEREETANKIKGLVSEREKNDILDLLKRRHDSQEEELKLNLKLQQDVEMEKLRKEISISKRFAMKESQNKVLQDLIKDAKLKEEQANAIMREHVANMAAIDKATDEERARRVMALEMRLAERRALARQKQEEEERKKKDLEMLGKNHAEGLENLVSSSKLNAEDAAVYLERFRKEREAIDIKLAKERKKQEQKLHQKLTALKQKRIEEKAREHQQQLKELDEQQNEKFEEVEIDTVAAINEKQRLLQKQRQEVEEIERFSDKEAAAEIENLRDQQQRETNQLVKNNTQKAYQELVNKGLSDSEKEAILERLTANLVREQEVRDEERRRQKEMIEKRLEKQRAALEKKMKQEQAEQAEVRKQEDKIVGDLIVNQVSMSEEERDRIMQEHEKNLAELESSLTLNKLRQRQKLEERLAERRKKRMEELEQKQRNEQKDRDYDDRILAEGENVEMIKKHEQEKILAMKDDETRLEDEMETVREEMLAERSKKLEEHHEKLGAIIAQLQIEKAKQVSKIAMQQHALSQLQEGLAEELDSKGTFQDPDTVKIMEKYQKETKKLEENLKNQKEKQEQALRDRLQERMKQREETLILKQKDEMSQYMANLNVNNTAMKLRKAAVKARHQKELNDLRNRMQKEIDQSINELKMTSDIRRLRAIEEQNIKLISIFVEQGKLKEDELESVLKYLFPGKSSNELDDLLSRIYGPNHNKSSGQSAFDPRRPSTLEDRIRRASFAAHSPPIEKHGKNRKKSKRKDDERRDLPPVNLKGSRKGLSLKESLHGYSTLTDAEENSARESARSNEEIRSLPNVNRRRFYQPLKDGDDQEIVDEMFGDSPEKVRTKSGKRHRGRRSRDTEDPTA